MSFLANMYVEAAAYLGAGGLVGLLALRWGEIRQRAAARRNAETDLENSRKEAEAIRREAKLAANEEALRIREQAEQHAAACRAEITDLQQRLNQREALINTQLEGLVQQEKDLRQQQVEIQKRLDQLDAQNHEVASVMQQRREELRRLSNLNEAEARALFLKQIEQEAQQDADRLGRQILDTAKARAEEKARRIISIAIQRYAGEHTFETTTATVELPGDEIKGRIIGREGRNIRAFEAATGVTVMIDDTPNAVVLSSFDPVRREVARESMERLIVDGRIHPTRIEEVVAKVNQEMDEAIVRAGEEAVHKAGLPPMHEEIIKLLGRLQFRQSFSQNILDHSIEVAHLMGLMAAELGIDTMLAKRTGLLHDIGKAVNHEMEGSHARVGSELIRRYGEAEEIVNAVASHHDEVPAHGPLGILVSAADAISASRPGARSETMTTYIKRVESLEKIGCSFPGVEKCFAVQAGRELRVLVQPEQIDDDQALALARNIARKIEEELQYPGQIRVTVVRETRCVEFAK